MAANLPAKIVGNAPDSLKIFSDYLERRKGALASVAANHMRPERLLKIVVGSVSRTPVLRNCTMESLFRSSLAAAELGLEPNSPLGECYMVPFKETCQLIIGYRGLVALARRSGEVSVVYAYVVYDTDDFSFCLGTEPMISHVPNFNAERDPRNIKFVYAVAELKGGGKQFDVMTRGEIDAIRGRSKAGGSGPWVTDYAEMAKKTVVRRLCKMLPMSIEMSKAVAVDTAADTGDNSIIEAEWLDSGIIEPETQEPPQTGAAAVKAKLEAAKPTNGASKAEVPGVAWEEHSEKEEARKALQAVAAQHGIAEIDSPTAILNLVNGLLHFEITNYADIGPMDLSQAAGVLAKQAKPAAPKTDSPPDLGLGIPEGESKILASMPN